ncbi:hypothetical protein EIN_267200 [Entamoeba invadens IP1]|uniref:Uncharacterized protein n=1 Tax=Entamoeba invadens IP1 TaxID=370355 RepID=A0A0A1U7V6_ENTIV|nr:hypothetical protein EIN_267200 [Entamoeba invadens IP1]ELP91014.1 hypothetical protein EIN_267200 [Entamoeba invadens IP1]|eukprot:XP_004257785.1 hypothetical protein EIN_267200 [Entamoeba invadens IP1]
MSKTLEHPTSEGLITISFSINYVTTYGEEVYVSLDDYTCKKLTWTPNHIWKGAVTLLRPRTLRWSYSVVEGSSIIRTEHLTTPRSYSLDTSHRYYHVFDKWDVSNTNVSPLTFSSITSPFLLSLNLNSSIDNNRSPIQFMPVFIPKKVVKDIGMDDTNTL